MIALLGTSSSPSYHDAWHASHWYCSPSLLIVLFVGVGSESCDVALDIVDYWAEGATNDDNDDVSSVKVGA